MTSIQRHLVVWLVVILAAGMAIVMAATYFFAFRQITQVFDDELVKVADAVRLGEDWAERRGLRIASPGFNLSVRAYDQRAKSYFQTDPPMPAELPRLYQSGFAVAPAAGGNWRLYTHATEEGIVQVGQPEAVRTSLARQLSFRMALPELVAIPFLVLFVTWVLRRGLSPLRDVSRRVEQRDASQLEPLPLDGVPVELRPLIAEINALLARLGESMAGQRRFVADAAHELRTPMAALALQAKVAERAAQPAARSAAFEELHNGIARGTRVVEQLLKLARLGPDVPREPLRPLDLAQVVSEEVGDAAYRALTLGVDLGADAPHPAPILGARAELRTLIANLLDNAFRHSPPQGQVTVTVSVESFGVLMTVLDEGPGIAPPDRERVFERFQRVSDDDSIGIGLGLAIVKAVVEHHGARIWLTEARPGRTPPGLAVCVLFPKTNRPGPMPCTDTS